MSTPFPANVARFTPWDVAAASGGAIARLAGRVGNTAVGVTSDSRAVVPGNAFVALAGDTFDGHDFVAKAIERGATLVVIGKGKAEPPAGVDVVVVDDTLAAWGGMARAHLRAWRRSEGTPAKRTVAITGSAGKTTTKALCATLLSMSAPCQATPGNLNNRVGVPAVAFSVTSEHRYVVFELGMSLSGEIAALAETVEPDVAVLLNVGVAHAGGVGGSRSDVAREKGAIFEQLGRRGVAVANLDDEASVAQLARTRALAAETFGRAEQARYRLCERVSLGWDGSLLTVERPRAPKDGGPFRESFQVRLPLLGEAAALDFLAALAAAESASGTTLDAAAIQRALAAHAAPAGRAEVSRLEGDVLLIDDTYNANPASMRAALGILSELAKDGGRRMVVVLGEMRELGEIAGAEHDALGDELVKTGIALAIGCGGLADRALDRAARGGVDVVKAASTEDAASVAAGRIAPRDVVLLKGSRGAAVEKVVAAITRTRAKLAAKAGRGAA